MASNRIIYYWPVIALAATTLISAGGLFTQFQALADDVEEAKQDIKQVKKEENDLEKKVVELATTQRLILSEQQKQSDKLDRILEKLN